MSAVDSTYENRKTGKHYELIARGTDQTNARAGERVAVYRSLEDPDRWFTREEREFEEKFRRVEPPDCCRRRRGQS